MVKETAPPPSNAAAHDHRRGGRSASASPSSSPTSSTSFFASITTRRRAKASRKRREKIDRGTSQQPTPSHRHRQPPNSTGHRSRRHRRRSSRCSRRGDEGGRAIPAFAGPRGSREKRLERRQWKSLKRRLLSTWRTHREQHKTRPNLRRGGTNGSLSHDSFSSASSFSYSSSATASSSSSFSSASSSSSIDSLSSSGCTSCEERSTVTSGSLSSATATAATEGPRNSKRVDRRKRPVSRASSNNSPRSTSPWSLVDTSSSDSSRSPRIRASPPPPVSPTRWKRAGRRDDGHTTLGSSASPPPFAARTGDSRRCTFQRHNDLRPGERMAKWLADLQADKLLFDRRRFPDTADATPSNNGKPDAATAAGVTIAAATTTTTTTTTTATTTGMDRRGARQSDVPVESSPPSPAPWFPVAYDPRRGFDRDDWSTLRAHYLLNGEQCKCTDYERTLVCTPSQHLPRMFTQSQLRRMILQFHPDKNRSIVCEKICRILFQKLFAAYKKR